MKWTVFMRTDKSGEFLPAVGVEGPTFPRDHEYNKMTRKARRILSEQEGETRACHPEYFRPAT